MGRDHAHRSRDPEDKRSSGRQGRAEGPVSRALKRGKSGYGVESLRPHLHDQLVLKDLLRNPFPSGKDDASNDADGADNDIQQY